MGVLLVHRLYESLQAIYLKTTIQIGLWVFENTLRKNELHFLTQCANHSMNYYMQGCPNGWDWSSTGK